MSKKILVVDDEADVRTFLTTVLRKHGYETETAENGRLGLEAVKRELPDLVTLDLQMPDQSGTDFYRRFTKDKDLRGIPVIVISGVPGRHLAVKGAVAVFDKPIDPDDFIAAVKKGLGEED